jgi:hypothetical protein
MPYEYLQGVHISGEEIYASTPNWLVVATEDVENGEGTPAVEVSEGQ